MEACMHANNMIRKFPNEGIKTKTKQTHDFWNSKSIYKTSAHQEKAEKHLRTSHIAEIARAASKAILVKPGQNQPEHASNRDQSSAIYQD